MAIIQSGASVDLLAVDPVSNAARVTIYSTDGTSRLVGADVYIQAWNSSLSAAATPAAGSSLFHMRNAQAASKRVFIRKIRLNFLTLVAATTPQMVDLEMIRTSGADASGGTSIAAASIGRKQTTLGNPVISDFRHSTAMAALTVVGITFGQQLATFLHLSTVNTVTQHEFDFSEAGPVVLRAGEGLAIRNITAIGAAMTWVMKGQIEWNEAT